MENMDMKPVRKYFNKWNKC